jgi:hypothetical protein
MCLVCTSKDWFAVCRTCTNQHICHQMVRPNIVEQRIGSCCSAGVGASFLCPLVPSRYPQRQSIELINMNPWAGTMSCSPDIRHVPISCLLRLLAEGGLSERLPCSGQQKYYIFNTDLESVHLSLRASSFGFHLIVPCSHCPRRCQSEADGSRQKSTSWPQLAAG